MDLQPYSCTFGNCPSASVTFGNRTDWINHEMTHSADIEWVCIEGCGKLFRHRNDFIFHLEEKHFLTATHGLDLDLVISRCQRYSTIRACPFCNKELKSKKHQHKHVGRHLEEISLNSLPSDIWHTKADLGHPGRNSDSSAWSDLRSKGNVEDEAIAQMDKGKSVMPIGLSDHNQRRPVDAVRPEPVNVGLGNMSPGMTTTATTTMTITMATPSDEPLEPSSTFDTLPHDSTVIFKCHSCTASFHVSSAHVLTEMGSGQRLTIWCPRSQCNALVCHSSSLPVQESSSLPADWKEGTSVLSKNAPGMYSVCESLTYRSVWWCW